MKIVYTCSYAYPSISGVWNRVENVAKGMLRKGHEVHILTSNIIAGTDNFAELYENYQGIHIHRFPVKLKFSKYQLLFTGERFNQILKKINPDIIDCQTYRHAEAKAALRYSLKNKIPCILTTHSPFLPVEVRGKKLSFLADVYDLLIGSRILNKYSRVFRISDWELKYLNALGLKEKKIVYSPNGIPKEFFNTELKEVRDQTLLFFGRIEPRKQVHVLIESFSKIADKYPKSKLLLLGPIENVDNYEERLKELIKSNNLEERVIFLGPIYDMKKKIKVLNSSHIYILPSTWEGFPQTLIEMMSLGKCIIASNCNGNMEVIKDNETGFLFNIGDSKELAEKIDYCLSNDTSKIEENAKKLSKNFTWEKIVDDVEGIYKELI
jgi:glycosyltransferase involved in cell wall biosynthesis